MAKKYLDNEDYFMCSGGIFPAKIHDEKNTFITQGNRKHLTHFDTATSKPDFTCKWAVVLAVAAAVFFALLASTPIGWAILAGLAVGIGAGGLILCGVMMAAGRKWIGYEITVIILKERHALTSDAYMTCALGGEIRWAPEITSPGMAFWTGARNLGFATLEGVMYGYAVYGATSLLTTAGRAAFIPNMWGGLKLTYGKIGLAVRVAFAVENVSYNNATGKYSGEHSNGLDIAKDGAQTFFGEAAPYINIGSKIVSGEADTITGGEIAQAIAIPFSFVGLNIQATGAEHQVPYALRKAANMGLVKGAGLFKIDIVAQRRQMALDFYKRNNPGMSLKDLKSHLNGIDFNMPIEVIEIAGGTELMQFTKVNTAGDVLTGEYYTNNPHNTPSELGISDKYSVRDPSNNWQQTDQVNTVEQKPVTIETTTEGLKSTSAPIEDTWSLKGESVPTEGHGSQVYIPKKK